MKEKKAEEIVESNVGQFEKAYKHAMTVLDNLMDDFGKKIRKNGERGDHVSANFYIHKLLGLRVAKRTIEMNIKMFLEHLVCHKTSGWRLYYDWMEEEKLIGEEYGNESFEIKVGGFSICKSNGNKGEQR